MAVRLPKPFSVTVITSPSSPMISEITRCFLPSLTPRTPQAVRPIARTSDSRKRIDLPAEVNSMMLCAPSVMSTPINWSSSRRSTAIMPLDRGREKSTSGVFFTVPDAVAMNTKRSSVYSRTGSTALMRSPCSSGSRLTIGRPRAVRPACGSS